MGHRSGTRSLPQHFCFKQKWPSHHSGVLRLFQSLAESAEVGDGRGLKGVSIHIKKKSNVNGNAWHYGSTQRQVKGREEGMVECAAHTRAQQWTINGRLQAYLGFSSGRGHHLAGELRTGGCETPSHEVSSIKPPGGGGFSRFHTQKNVQFDSLY